ncbi:MAG: glycosyltransferase family 4 protein [Propionibacteriaceae bacterium]|nr:glycosyltransferase family 4 protein [Propionibacteriaceae bacterium]
MAPPTPAGRSLRLIVPVQGQISGGQVFNTELARALGGAGWAVEVREISGDWPSPTPAEREHVRVALTAPPGPVVAVDGIIGSACPDEIGAAVTAGVTVLVLVHMPLPAETGLPPDQQAALAELEARALHAASAVTACSHWSARDLHRRYPRLPAIHVLTPGAEPAPVATGSEPPRLLMVGALTPVKNHATALAALAEVADLPWQALLVGPQRDGRVLEEVRRTLRTPALAGRVGLPGELHGAALEGAWQGGDLLLVPSWAETFGLVVTEALAHGIPAVVARGTGAVEALTGTAAGAIRPRAIPGAVADPGDPGAWAAILRAWLTDRTRREGWRRLAHERRRALRRWSDTAGDFARIVTGLP